MSKGMLVLRSHIISGYIAIHTKINGSTKNRTLIDLVDEKGKDGIYLNPFKIGSLHETLLLSHEGKLADFLNKGQFLDVVMDYARQYASNNGLTFLNKTGYEIK